MPIGTPALTLDSFIAKSRGQLPLDPASPLLEDGTPNGWALSRGESNDRSNPGSSNSVQTTASSSKRSASLGSGPSSSGVGLTRQHSTSSSSIPSRPGSAARPPSSTGGSSTSMTTSPRVSSLPPRATPPLSLRTDSRSDLDLLPSNPSSSSSSGGMTARPPPTPMMMGSSGSAAPGSRVVSNPNPGAGAGGTPMGSPHYVGSGSRRQSGNGGGNGGSRRSTRRRPTFPAVPPISVLIVEDNLINQRILSKFMTNKGIKFGVAKDGEEAVQKWKAGNYQLVLMDIQLPVKDGIEATREIREIERQNDVGTFVTTPSSDRYSLFSPLSSNNSTGVNSPVSPSLRMPVIIVALTASSLQIDRVSALAAGCNDFLTKPVSLSWLEKKVLEWGSMVYLSGFSMTDSNASSTIPSPTGGFGSSLSRVASDSVSAHLHIERKPHTSKVASPSGQTGAVPSISAKKVTAPPETSDGSATPESPSDDKTAMATATAATPEGPQVNLIVPTPGDTPLPGGGALSAVTAAAADAMTPLPEEGDDPGLTKSDLKEVDSALKELQIDSDVAPHRPGPSPLMYSHELGVDEVVAEGARLAESSRLRDRSASHSFTSVMMDSGTMKDA